MKTLLLVAFVLLAVTACNSESERTLIDPVPTIEAQPNMAMVPSGLISNAYDQVVFEIVRSPISNQCYEIIRYRADVRSTTSHSISCTKYTPEDEQ